MRSGVPHQSSSAEHWAYDKKLTSRPPPHALPSLSSGAPSSSESNDELSVRRMLPRHNDEESAIGATVGRMVL
jgi:hypothetical protein